MVKLRCRDYTTRIGFSLRSMRCRLSRSCVRWLKYLVVMTFAVLLLAHGLMSLSKGHISAYSVEFDSGLVPYEEYKDIDKVGGDYDTVIKEPRADMFAKIDETLRLERENALDEHTEDSDVHDEFIIEKPRDFYKQKRVEIKESTRVLDVRRHKKTTHKTHVFEKDEMLSSQTLTILINSYGVNKSTVLDSLFQDRADVIIFREPSLTLQPLWYFRGDNQFCSMKDTTCVLAGYDTSVHVNRCLSGLARCSLDAISNCIGPTGTVTHTDIQNYKSCKRKAITYKTMLACHRMLQTLCKAAKVKVISTRNIALDVSLRAQNYINNFMVGHVFRDARHVVYSEKMSRSSYLNEDGDAFFKRVTNLCNRAQYDLDTIAKNQFINTDLFFNITNEELLIDSDTALEKLSAIFTPAVTGHTTIYDVIKDGAHKIIANQMDSAKDWTQHMDTNAVELAYVICADVNNRLGYRVDLPQV